jgi:hypothetical protein
MNEPVPNQGRGADAFDRQVAALAGRLRDDGIAPSRDLWSGIAAGLDAAGPAAGVRSGRDRTPARSRSSWPQAALAAGIVLAIGLGLTPRGPTPGDTASRQRGEASAGAPGSEMPSAAATPANAARDGLRALAQALDHVEAALAQSPDDPDLSRLVLLIHNSRGRLLRLQAEGSVRDARRGPA